MNYKVNELYKITGDVNNVIINQRKVKMIVGEDGKRKKSDILSDEYTPIAYYPNLKLALKHLIDLDINSSELSAIEDIVNRIEELKEAINAKSIIELTN